MIANKKVIALGALNYYSKLFNIITELDNHYGDLIFQVIRNSDGKVIEVVEERFENEYELCDAEPGSVEKVEEHLKETGYSKAYDFFQQLKSKHILDTDQNFLRLSYVRDHIPSIKCMRTQCCQETEGFKGTEHEGVDMCEDGCVQGKVGFEATIHIL